MSCRFSDEEYKSICAQVIALTKERDAALATVTRLRVLIGRVMKIVGNLLPADLRAECDKEVKP